jgi:short-subunit dehydrogenase
MSDTKNKIVWITGASSGIGEALAIYMARQGYCVAVSARSADKLQQLAGQNYGAGRIVAYPADVTNAEVVAKTVAAIQHDLGQLNIAVLNAGTHIPEGGIELNMDAVRKQFDINVFSVMECLRQLIPSMRQNHGHIAVVASVAGYRGLPRAIGYGASKSALITMTEAMRLDCEKLGIKLQLICPGFVKTPLTDKNDFPMPFLIGVDKAAAIIYRGLMSSRFEIVFPWPMAVVMKLLRILPYRLYFAAIRAVTGVGKS